MSDSQVLEQAIHAFQFEKAFCHLLGWPRFEHQVVVSVRDAHHATTISRPSGVPITTSQVRQFAVDGIAICRGQRFVKCEAVSTDYITQPQRIALVRTISAIHHRPIIVFSSQSTSTQDWYFPSLGYGRPHTFTCDSRSCANRLANALLDLRLPANQADVSTNMPPFVDVVARVAAALIEHDESPGKSRYAAKFSQYGPQAVEMAKLAYDFRCWSPNEQTYIARKAKSGDPRSIDRFYKMHLHAVLHQALSSLKHRELAGVEFEDLVGAGILGIASGLQNYGTSADVPPGPLLYFHISKHIADAFRRFEPPIRIPQHIQEQLHKAQAAEDQLRDRLTQQLQRCPSDEETLEALGVPETLHQAYALLNIGRRPGSLVSLDILDEQQLALNRYERRRAEDGNFLLIQAFLRLDQLPCRHKEAILMRYGLHHSAYGQEFTLDDIGKHLGVTRERARQMIVHSLDKIKSMPWFDIDRLSERGIPIRRGHLCAGRSSFGDGDSFGKATSASAPSAADWNALPRPTPSMRRANEYVDFLLRHLGAGADAEYVHRAMLRFFPSSKLKIDRIRRKLEVMSESSSLGCKDRMSGLGHNGSGLRSVSHGVGVQYPGLNKTIVTDEQYVDAVLQRLGPTVDAELVHKAILRYSPNTRMNVAAIERKIEVLKARSDQGKQVCRRAATEAPRGAIDMPAHSDSLPAPTSRPAFPKCEDLAPVEPGGAVTGDFGASAASLAEGRRRSVAACGKGDSPDGVQPVADHGQSNSVYPPSYASFGANGLSRTCNGSGHPTRGASKKLTPAELVPAPPRHIRSSDGYLDFLTDFYGCRFTPEAVLKAVLSRFPDCNMGLETIRGLYRKKGWKVEG